MGQKFIRSDIMGETLRQIKAICDKAEKGLISYEDAMEKIKYLTK
uniref:Uncharacterized protein n=1 Tax=Bacillus phage KoopaTroopa TaxID=3234046 RepID=A0AB39C7K7_9CAUD